MMSIEIASEHASLVQLQRTSIDTVLSSIDQGLVHLPSYRELYYRWERQQWQVQEIDFISDRIQWEDLSEEEQEDHLYSMASFFQGEASVADALAPYVIAMPDEEMRLFVTTQLVDEARHTVFFARFFEEVMGIDEGSLEETLALARQWMNPSMKHILIDSLIDIAERMRKEPHNLAQLVEGVSLYHVVVEGTMALAGQRNLLERYRRENLFPGFRGGFTAVARDESRHVIFGVKFLRDMIQRNPASVDVIRAAIQRYAPVAIKGLTPPDEAMPQMLAVGEDPWLVPRYGVDSLRKKLKVVGIEMELPSVPPPPS
jgi:ribonucleoside-diphosphate reductase beta chain